MSKIAFQGGMLIRGNGDPAVENSLVLVDGKKIVYAGEGKPVPEGYETRGIEGKTIMPGLIDSHLHFDGNLTGDDSEWVTESNIQKAVVATEQARVCLARGITTVGEVSRFGIAIRDMIEAGVVTVMWRLANCTILWRKPESARWIRLRRQR